MKTLITLLFAAGLLAGRYTQAKIISREYINNGLFYNFLFETAPTELRENGGPEVRTDSLVRVRFRISVPAWNQSPFRFALGSLEEYEQRLRFFSFVFREHIALYQDGTRCTLLDYHLDANLNAAPFETIQLIFRLSAPVTDTREELRLAISDPMLLKGSVDIIISNAEL